MAVLARVILVLVLFASPVTCFSVKQPPCAFTCVELPHLCPANYTCGDDGLCYRDGTDGGCSLTPPDAGGPPDDAFAGGLPGDAFAAGR